VISLSAAMEILPRLDDRRYQRSFTRHLGVVPHPELVGKLALDRARDLVLMVVRRPNIIAGLA
jgi:hypothetical protein